MSLLLKLASVAAIMMLTACTPVKPWEKGAFARNEMGFIPDSVEARMETHIYFAKEASSSASAVSGGGCGCN